MKALISFLIMALTLYCSNLLGQTKASTGAAASGSFIPPGVVMPYAGSVAPSGWVFAYGQEVSQTSSTYKNLYAAISTTYCVTGHGTGACGGGNFRIPDMRGRNVTGKDNMGGSAASRITVAKTIDGTALAANGGGQNVAGHYHGMTGGGSNLSVSITHDHAETSVTGSVSGGGVDHTHNEQGGCSGGGAGSLVISRAANDDPPGTNCSSINYTLGATAFIHQHTATGGSPAGTLAVDIANWSESKTPTGSIGLVSTGCDGNTDACNNLAPTTILNYIIKL